MHSTQDGGDTTTSISVVGAGATKRLVASEDVVGIYYSDLSKHPTCQLAGEDLDEAGTPEKDPANRKHNQDISPIRSRRWNIGFTKNH